MAEKIAEKFENAMKIGFISALILIVLEKDTSYGYKICKQIERRTLGIWNPASSTMYTALKDMTEKGLITFIEKQVDGRNRKIYEVTPKGKETLKIMLEKHNAIEESIETLKIAMLGDEKGELPKGFHKIGPFDLILNRLDEKSDDEKLEYLKLQKLRFSIDKERLTTTLQRIEENITLLNKKLNKKES
ncbi:MAG: PadR family transcriptional regulator [Candidatus Lokiarchaeota archaeon]|nr:PadR family transcriptional regulator [Candidatus Lokiarchaeota archaeon]